MKPFAAAGNASLAIRPIAASHALDHIAVMIASGAAA